MLKGYRNEAGVQAALGLAYVHARRTLRAMTRCQGASDFAAYQGAYVAYETMIQALGGTNPITED